MLTVPAAVLVVAGFPTHSRGADHPFSTVATTNDAREHVGRVIWRVWATSGLFLGNKSLCPIKRPLLYDRLMVIVDDDPVGLRIASAASALSDVARRSSR